MRVNIKILLRFCVFWLARRGLM